MLIRIYHTYAAVKHKKADLSLERSAEINFEFIKFVKKIYKSSPFDERWGILNVW